MMQRRRLLRDSCSSSVRLLSVSLTKKINLWSWSVEQGFDKRSTKA
jgi:hypothetical protein